MSAPIRSRPRQPMQVTPRAVEIHQQMERVYRRRSLNNAGCTSAKNGGRCGYTRSEACAVCTEWLDLHTLLHRELGLRLWDTDAIPFSPVVGARRAFDGQQRKIWAALQSAARALRKTKTTAGDGGHR